MVRGGSGGRPGGGAPASAGAGTPSDPGDDPDGGLHNVKEYPPDRYRKVGPAQNFARQKLKIKEVDYAGHLRIANTCNRAILSLTKRGVPVPYGLRVDAGEFQTAREKQELAVYEPLLADPDAPGRIIVNPSPKVDVWAQDPIARSLKGQWSTGSRYHAIVHEMGELLYHQTVGTTRFEPGSDDYEEDERFFRHYLKGKKPRLAKLVSAYAVRNHGEFVCEVWTALMLGRTELLESELVMDIYQDLEGPTGYEHGR